MYPDFVGNVRVCMYVCICLKIYSFDSHELSLTL